MALVFCTACGADLEKVVREASDSDKVTTLAPADESELTMELAGNILSHAAESISKGEKVMAILGYDTRIGRKMQRAEAATAEEAKAIGEANLNANSMHSLRAVLLYTDDTTIYIKIRSYSQGRQPALLALPYRPPGAGLPVDFGKAAFREGVAPEESAGFLRAIGRGIDSYPEGARLLGDVL
ncbi:MAG: hypothetical protein AB7W16_14575 [Candidatus Obscuribacterales bacterium]